MGTAETGRATVSNKPGAGNRILEATRGFVVFLIPIVLFAGISLFTQNRKTIAALGFSSAAIVAMGFISWAKRTGQKGSEFDAGAVDVRDDAVPEEDVGMVLGALPGGHFVMNDFLSPRGTIDHIVVSAKGILIIETKDHKGVVTSDGEMLKRDGRLFENDLIKQAWAHSFCVRDLLFRHGIQAPKPQPVILFTNADVRVRERVKGVEIIGRRFLPVYLERLQKRLTKKEAETIFELLKFSQASMFV